ncbi:hypothetical protein [Henriciella marina]|uniref:hypothetical protein n=1 Tax=Henriciella marina TaxID=453851 RepID=UPI00036E6CC0|nr:hypothetical protein [Henriciella marina]
MKSATLLSMLVGFPLLASAALPPHFQRQRELVSIIESGDVADALKGRPIDAIEADGTDSYVVRGGDCRVSVQIISPGERMLNGWAGPRPYELDVGEADCLAEGTRN